MELNQDGNEICTTAFLRYFGISTERTEKILKNGEVVKECNYYGDYSNYDQFVLALKHLTIEYDSLRKNKVGYRTDLNEDPCGRDHRENLVFPIRHLAYVFCVTSHKQEKHEKNLEKFGFLPSIGPIGSEKYGHKPIYRGHYESIIRQWYMPARQFFDKLFPNGYYIEGEHRFIP